MTAILLTLLIGQPIPDESMRVVQNLAAQLGEAQRLMEDDPEGAIRLLSWLLDNPKARELEGRSQGIRVFREQALYLRGQLQLQQGQAQTVADDMTALLDRKRVQFLSRVAGLVGALAFPLPSPPPGTVLGFRQTDPLSRRDCLQALVLRAEAYKELGQHDKEQADRAETMEILHEIRRGSPINPYQYLNPPSRGVQEDLRRLVSGITGLLVVAATFVVMVPGFFLMGLGQRRDAGGTWRRLFWVSLALAVLQTIPVLAAFVLLRWGPGFFFVSALPFVTLLVFVINIVRHGAYLSALKWAGSREAPPLLEDKTVLCRIAQIASRLGIAAPVTRLVRSSSSSLQMNNALVSGLVAPTMLLYDGILYRLAEEERDAIIAHELAHLANHTFWYWLAAGTVTGVAVVAASTFYPILVALGLGLALLTGTWLILSRRLELDCDQRAARAIGHRQAASALAKIHADQPFRGLIEFLIGAVSTHPSRDERLAAIRLDAPNDDRPEVEWDSRMLVYRRLAAWVAAWLWLAIVVASLLWGYRSPGSNWPVLPLVLMEVALVVLVWLGLGKTARRQRRLQRARPTRLKRLAWLMAALLGSFLAAYSFGLTQLYLHDGVSLAILLGGFFALLAVVLLLGSNRAKRLNHKIVIAIGSGDFPRALALAERNSTVVARSTELRYNHALTRAVLGQREEALGDLERLRRDDPGFKMTWLLLASLYADEGEYARALELATELSQALPGDPGGPLAESWLLRKVGRLEEAETRAREVLESDPRSGQAHLTLAAVAIDRGDYAAAREQLAVAERLEPGSMAAALLVAEMALVTKDVSAEAAVRQAVNAARNNPLAFADKEVARLAVRLEGRQASPG